MLTLKSLVLAFASTSAAARGLFASDASEHRSPGRSLLQLEEGEIPTRANILSFDALPAVTPPCNPMPGEPCTDGIMLLNDLPLEPAPNMPLSVTRTPNEQFDFPGSAFTASQVRAVFAALAILVRAPRLRGRELNLEGLHATDVSMLLDAAGVISERLWAASEGLQAREKVLCAMCGVGAPRQHAPERSDF